MNRLLRPGFKFRDGKLIISTKEEVKIIHSWPDLKAIRKPTDRKAWSNFVPLFRLLRPKSLADDGDSLGSGNVRSTALDPLFEKQLAVAHFRSSVPPEITKSVERFTNRQWMLLALCKRREQAGDLLEQNPALGFAVAQLQKFSPTRWQPMGDAVKISAVRQRDMLGWIGFPKTQAWAKILAKIPPEVVTLERLKSLRDVANIPETENQLQHLRSINGWVIDLVSERRFSGMVAPTLLSEIGESPDDTAPQEAFHLLEDMFNLAERLPRRPNQQRIRSLEALRSKHQEVVAEFTQFLKREQEEKILPAPPLPGSPEIVPLTSADDLVQEGRDQHNCVGGYTKWVHDGNGYIYRVLAPERATLSIVPGADGCWCIDQLKLACNRPTNIETHNAVQAWINQYSLSV
jgi:hypothetical protein